jgi:hypothetical protein
MHAHTIFDDLDSVYLKKMLKGSVPWLLSISFYESPGKKERQAF